MIFSEIEELSNSIIMDYYQNNLDSFFNHLSKNCVYIGPLKDQWFEGREKMRALWTAEAGHGLQFSISNIRSNLIKVSRSACEVFLHFRLYTHYDSGIINLDDVRVQMTWRDFSIEEDIVPRIVLMHVSYAAPKSDRDIIYPIHGEDIASVSGSTQTALPMDTGVRVYIRCTDKSFLYLISSHILWIESFKKGNHSIVHTLDGDYETTHALRVFEDKYGDSFLRAHASYLINPLHVKDLTRFQLTMTDGTIIPVPEKKYTSFKSELNTWLHKWHRG